MIGPALVAFLGGAALAAAHLNLLGASVATLTAGGSALRVVLLGLLRLAAAVAVFGIAARQGAMPLLFALAGFAAVRLVLVERIAGRLR